MRISRALHDERAQGRPGIDRYPRPPCNKKSTGKEPQVQSRIRPSLRNGFTTYFALSPGTGLSCSCRRADRTRATWPQRRETRTTRLHRPHQRRSSARNRARRQHVHRSPHSTSVTTRPSLFDRGRLIRMKAHNSEKRKLYFSPLIWTADRSTPAPRTKHDFARARHKRRAERIRPPETAKPTGNGRPGWLLPRRFAIDHDRTRTGYFV